MQVVVRMGIDLLETAKGIPTLQTLDSNDDADTGKKQNLKYEIKES